MDWKRAKFSRWTSGNFSITEIEAQDCRPYQLDSLDVSPEFFGSLREAQAVARLKNELSLLREDNLRLRAEADARNGHAKSAMALVEATRQPANAAGPDSWEDGDKPDPSLPAADDGIGPNGRGIPSSSSQQGAPVDSADVAAISGRLIAVMARKGHVPRIFAGAND